MRQGTAAYCLATSDCPAVEAGRWRAVFIAAPATGRADARPDGGEVPADRPRTTARRPKRCTRDTGKPLSAGGGCRKDKYALNGKFSCYAPSVRRRGAAGMNRIVFLKIPEQKLGAEFRGGEPAPGKDTSFSGKPRNPDERLHAHAANLVACAGFFKATQCHPQGAVRIRSPRTRRASIRTCRLR